MAQDTMRATQTANLITKGQTWREFLDRLHDKVIELRLRGDDEWTRCRPRVSLPANLYEVETWDSDGQPQSLTFDLDEVVRLRIPKLGPKEPHR